VSASFTAQLRVNRPTIAVGTGGTLTFRVEVSEVWDTVRVVASPDTTVREVKQRVLAAVLPQADFTDDYVLKLRGWEMLDQGSTLGDSGVVEGSILLLAHRRRRIVR
jgi:hypothetical protein